MALSFMLNPARKRIAILAVIFSLMLSMLSGAFPALVQHGAAQTVGAAYDAHARGELATGKYLAVLHAATVIAYAVGSLIPEADAHSTWVCYETGWFYDIDRGNRGLWVNIDVIGSGPNGSVSVRHHHLWDGGYQDYSYHTCYT